VFSSPALTPPYLLISKTPFSTGAITSGAGVRTNGHVVFAGGHIGNTSAVSNVVHSFDLKTGTATTLAPLPTARAGLGLAEFLAQTSNSLFAIGGVDANGNALNTVEIYDPTKNTWSEGAPMPTARAYLAVVAGTDGFIYAIGGSDSSGHALSTVEAYSPGNNNWQTVASLNTARSHLSAILAPPLGLIIAGGGIDANGNFLASTEGFGLTSKGSGWTPLVSFNVARADFGFSIGGDGFFHVIGGRNSTGELKSIEGGNAASGHFIVEPNSLPRTRSKLVSVEGLDGTDYFLGGSHGKSVSLFAQKGVPPAAPSHSVVYFLHGFDEPFINGNFAMDGQVPLVGQPIQLGIGAFAKWATFPAVNGTIGSGGTVVVNIPETLDIGVNVTFNLYAQDLDGGSQQSLGSASFFLGIGVSQVQIPITTPVTLQNKVLVLTLSATLGLNLNLTGGGMSMVVSGLTGTPSN
jgi:hypothetical protein